MAGSIPPWSPALAGVAEIIHVSKPYKQVSREWKPEPTRVPLPDGSTVGGREVVVMAGPCSVESEEQILLAARQVKAAGATVLPGRRVQAPVLAVLLPGHGRRGLELLAQARAETGLLIVTEAMDAEGLESVAEVADIIQIGARSMQNYPLLKECGRLRKPILLKRGLAATIVELLLSAEYILAEGNPNVILCERGIRSFDTDDPQPLRSRGHRRGARPVAPADRCRPEPRHRPPRHGACHGPRGGRRRRRRAADRGAPQSRARTLRRRPEPVSPSSSSG